MVKLKGLLVLGASWLLTASLGSLFTVAEEAHCLRGRPCTARHMVRAERTLFGENP
jgi:hypothetical protein